MNYWHQPDIDPVIFHLWGPLQIRWYSLLYVSSFILGGYLAKRLAREDRFKFNEEQIDRFIMWSLLGAAVGARIVYCVVYDPQSLMANPFFLFEVYRGGLSFHGGLLGVITVMLIFGRLEKIPFWNLADCAALVTPPGLAMGRLGNFINGELYGRVTDVPWGVIFKHGGPLPRHPSQLYELFFEGIVLFVLLWSLKKYLKKDGTIALVFMCGYSLIRFGVEFFREPDAHIGFLLMGFSMGQWLSIAMGVASIVLVYVRMHAPDEPVSSIKSGKKKKK